MLLRARLRKVSSSSAALPRLRRRPAPLRVCPLNGIAWPLALVAALCVLLCTAFLGVFRLSSQAALRPASPRLLGSPPFIATAAVGAPAIPASASGGGDGSDGGGGAARELRTFAKTLKVAAVAAAAAAVRVAAMEGTPEHETGGGVGVDGGGGSAEPRRIPAGYVEEARLAEPLSVAAIASSVEGARVAAAAAAAAAAASSRKSPPPPRAPRAPLSAPVDAVWTHVTADDAAWRRAYTAAVAGEPTDALSGVPDALRGSATMRALSRGNKFRDWGELRYSMRSLAAHAPWLRRFFVVVAGAGQVPRWLNASHPRLTVVYHAELFAAAGATDALPTFNSLAIESVLHHLPGVAPRFLYVNNDVMLGRATSLDDFISPRDGAHINFLDWRIGMSQECSALVYATDGPPAPEDPAYAAAGCFAQPFVYDVVLALATWGVMHYFWPPHMP